MKKLKIFLSVLVMLLVSSGVAWAVVQTLNGQAGSTQTFSNDTNITINSASDVHSLGWTGHLSVSRGGTGNGSFTSGSILFASAASLSQDNSNLFWDNTNKRLGVGTNSPAQSVDVAGNVKATQVISNTVAATGTNQSLALNPTGTGRVVIGGDSIVVASKSSEPAGPKMGQIYFDTMSGRFKGFNGSSWVSLSGGTTASVSFLVIAGGGGGGGGNAGGSNGSGGGGAGGYKYNNSFTITASSYSVVIGAGGSAGAQDTDGGDGGNSSFSTTTVIGGGGGGAANTVVGHNGGSGGGGGMGAANGTGTVGQGNDGGDGISPDGGGGGGGASGVGSDSPDGSAGGAGGNGTSSSISGSLVTRAGGGGGGGTTDGAGGSGGGGSSGGAGTANTGSGGGGRRTTGAGGAGGSGIVIVSYPTGSITATGGTITTSGGNTIHTFTSNGTFAVTDIP